MADRKFSPAYGCDACYRAYKRIAELERERDTAREFVRAAVRESGNLKAEALREAAESISSGFCHCTPNMTEGNGQCVACDIADSIRYDAGEAEGGRG